MTPNKTTAISLAIASALVLGTTPVHANTFYGTGAGTGNTGSDNTAFGDYSLSNSSSGSNNTASGSSSLSFNTTGSFNTAIGYAAGYKNAIGAYNVFLGRQAGYNELGSNKLYISNNATTPLLYGVFSGFFAGRTLRLWRLALV